MPHTSYTQAIRMNRLPFVYLFNASRTECSSCRESIQLNVKSLNKHQFTGAREEKKTDCDYIFHLNR